MATNRDERRRIETRLREVLNEAFDDLKRMDYMELERIAEAQNGKEEILREFVIDGSRGYVLSSTFRLGLPLRRRVGVELRAVSDTLSGKTPCVYFERYLSGRIRLFKIEKWIVLFVALLALVVAAIGAFYIG